MLEIMPNTTARGGNAFSAMLTAPPLPFAPTADLEGHDAGPPEVDAQKVDVAMDIDQEESVSLVSSSPTTKRKIAAITPDNQSSVVLSEGSLATSPTVSMPTMSSEPVRKKHTKSTPSASSSKSKLLSSAAVSSRPSRVALRSTSSKLTPATLVHEMQGSIGVLAAAVRESGASDPAAKLRQDAVHAVSIRDDGLSAAQRVRIIQLFTRDYASVQTYLALLGHDEIRKDWLQQQLE